MRDNFSDIQFFYYRHFDKDKFIENLNYSNRLYNQLSKMLSNFISLTGLSEDDLTQIPFRPLDEQYFKFLQNKGAKMLIEIINKQYKLIDADGNGTIEFHELLQIFILFIFSV